jgi:hypothetical protein
LFRYSTGSGGYRALFEFGDQATGERRSLVLSGSKLAVSHYSDNHIATTDLVDGQVYHAVGTVSSAGAVTMYLNGVAEAISSGDGTAALTSYSGTTAYIGRTGTGEYFGGEIHHVKAYNLALTATEVKELYSGASVPFKYKGANQTELIAATNDRTFAGASNWANASFNSYDESGDLSVTANGTNQYAQLPAVNAPMTAGKTYRLTYDASTIVGTFNIHDVSSFQVLVSDFAPSSSNSHEFTVTDSRVIGGLRLRSASSDASGNFDNFSLVQIGAVAEYDGSGAGEKIWGDKSGNDLHGTVSGATLENTPYDSGTEYEEGEWTAVVSDGSTPFTMNSSNTTGYYTKVGNLVTVSGYFITTSANGLTSEAIRITGLPFTIANDSAAYSGGAAAEGYNYAITAGHSVSYYGGVNSTNIYLNVWDSTGGISGMRADEWTDNGRVIIGFSYRAA